MHFEDDHHIPIAGFHAETHWLVPAECFVHFLACLDHSHRFAHFAGMKFDMDNFIPILLRHFWRFCGMIVSKRRCTVECGRQSKSVGICDPMSGA